MSIQNLKNSNDMTLYCGNINIDGNVSDNQILQMIFTGPFSTNQSTDLYLSKVGKCATITFKQLFSQCNNSSVIQSFNFLPSAYYPASGQLILQKIYVFDNATSIIAGPLVDGSINISDTGGITIAVNYGTAFSATNNAGWFGFSISYTTV